MKYLRRRLRFYTLAGTPKGMEMRKLLLFSAVLQFVPLLARAQDDSWRNRPAPRAYRPVSSNSMFDLTPFGGYRYGGTLYADQSNLFGRDVAVSGAGNAGLSFGIPLGGTGMKLELMVDRQNTHFTDDDNLFSPGANLGSFEITYFHGGLLVPFAQTRSVTPYAIVSAGVANLKPDVRGVSADNRFSASAGIGVKVPISRNLSFRIEERGYFTSLGNDRRCSRCSYYDYNHDLYQGETNVGIGVSF